VIAVAVLGTAGVLAGGREVGGRPTALDGAAAPPGSAAPSSMPEFPPVLPGAPVAGAGSPNPTVVPAGGTGLFRATGTYEGATETRVAVRLVRGEVADRPAPAGYRWVVASIEATLRVDGELLYGAGNNVRLLADRDQFVDAVFNAGADTVALCGADQQSLPGTPSGRPRIECAAFLVPVATAVRGVVYADRSIDALGAHALLFPADLPATGPAAVPSGEGQVGGPPLEVDTTSGYAEVAITDVIHEPSAYLADPIPPPGTRLHVVRFSMRASGIGPVRLAEIADNLNVLDDRGLLVPRDSYVGYELRDCPDAYKDIPPIRGAQGCLVFGLASDATISRIVYQPRATDVDPTGWRVWQPPA
jgi:hypothetical protein